MKHSVFIGLLIASQFITSLCVAEEAHPPVYFVLLHTPGPNWNHNLTSTDQPGIEQHYRYMNKLKEAGKIILGGHYLDAAGGMMIFQLATLEQARRAANDDPAVKSGLLQEKVRSWQAELSSVRIVKTRKSSDVLDRKQPFKIKSANRGAPINLEEKPK